MVTLAMESVKMSNDLLAEVKNWETNRKNYLQQVEPLLAQQAQQLQNLFQIYLSSLSEIITSQGFEDTTKREIVAEESKKFEIVKQQLFGHRNAGLLVLEKEIDARKNILYLEKRIILIQAVWRGYKARKKWGRVLKREKHRTKLANEVLATERGKA